MNKFTEFFNTAPKTEKEKTLDEILDVPVPVIGDLKQKAQDICQKNKEAKKALIDALKTTKTDIFE